MAEECRSCHVEVWWATGIVPDAKNPDGKSNPINHPRGQCPGTGDECTHEGNLAVWRDEMRLLKWRSLRKRLRPCSCDQVAGDVDQYCDEHGAHGGPIKPGEHRAISHWATCRDRKDWKSKQEARQ